LVRGEFGLAPADFLRVHDLVGLAFLEDAVLMNAARMREGIFADDRLAALHDESAHARDETRAFHDLAGVHAGVEAAEKITARLERHHDFLEGRVARALADAVDGAFDLARAGADGG
jgi:hypothetical protein